MKLKYILSLLVVVGCMSSCYDDDLLSVQVPQRPITVTLNLGGEITTSDSPLTRAGSGNDIYGIQVYKDGEPFAHGVFDNVDNVKINLLAGSKYKFVASMVKDGKDKLLHDFAYYKQYDRHYISYDNSTKEFFFPNTNTFMSDRYILSSGGSSTRRTPYYYSNNDTYLNYYLYNNEERSKSINIYYSQPVSSREDAFLFPFCYLLKKGDNISFSLVYNHEITNSMMYNGEYDTDFTSLNMLDEGYSTMADGTLTTYPEVDRFYGEVDNYTPVEGGALTIDMKRAAFGLKCQVSGISDGSVHVKVANDSRTFFENEAITDNTMSADQIFTFASVRDAWIYADNYIEKLNVTVDWLRGIGVTENLGTVKVTVKRNVMNVIRINLGAVDASSRMSINVEEDTFMDNNSIDVLFEQ